MVVLFIMFYKVTAYPTLAHHSQRAREESEVLSCFWCVNVNVEQYGELENGQRGKDALN